MVTGSQALERVWLFSVPFCGNIYASGISAILA